MLVSSAGGHWVELRRLDPAFAGFEKLYVTTKAEYESQISDGQFFVVPDAMRWNKFLLLRLCFSMLALLLMLRPACIVTTGSAPGFFALFWGKKLGIKTVWLESISSVEEMSLSGRKAKPYADLWLTQWEHLAGTDGPYFKGSIL